MKEYFKEQIEYYPTLTEDVLEKVEFKRVWSGKLMGVGDKVLYAFVFEKNTENIKLISFLERELHELYSKFIFVNYDEMTRLPILRFKN